MPHNGVNDRQPVNPPDPENVDMTELLTRMVSQFQPQTQTPVSNNVATPIAIKVPQPVATEPIKINPTIVQPIETEPIKIKPNQVEPPVEPKPIKTKEPKVKIKPSVVEWRIFRLYFRYSF
jgi:hypothetical protein